MQPPSRQQATLARLGVQNNSLADYVYIADNVFMNRPSPRLEVRCCCDPEVIIRAMHDSCLGPLR